LYKFCHRGALPSADRWGGVGSCVEEIYGYKSDSASSRSWVGLGFGYPSRSWSRPSVSFGSFTPQGRCSRLPYLTRHSQSPQAGCSRLSYLIGRSRSSRAESSCPSAPTGRSRSPRTGCFPLPLNSAQVTPSGKNYLSGRACSTNHRSITNLDRLFPDARLSEVDETAST